MTRGPIGLNAEDRRGRFRRFDRELGARGVLHARTRDRGAGVNATWVPLHQAKADHFRMLGRPLRLRVLGLLQNGPMPVRGLLTELLRAARRVLTDVLSGQHALLTELRQAEADTVSAAGAG